MPLGHTSENEVVGNRQRAADPGIDQAVFVHQDIRQLQTFANVTAWEHDRLRDRAMRVQQAVIADRRIRTKLYSQSDLTVFTDVDGSKQLCRRVQYDVARQPDSRLDLS